MTKYLMPTFYLSHTLAYLGEKMLEWACFVQRRYFYETIV